MVGHQDLAVTAALVLRLLSLELLLPMVVAVVEGRLVLIPQGLVELAVAVQVYLVAQAQQGLQIQAVVVVVVVAVTAVLAVQASSLFATQAHLLMRQA